MSAVNKIVVNRVPGTLHTDLKNVSDNMGIPMASLVKSELTKAMAAMPPALKMPKKKD